MGMALQRTRRSYKSALARTWVANVSSSARPTRAGVIMYGSYQGTVYIGLGIDANSHELTDFGGGVDYKVDPDAIVGGLREFQEETLGIFQPLTPADVPKSVVLCDSKNLVIFVHVPMTPDAISSAFNAAYAKRVDSNNQIRDRKAMFNEINTNDLYDPEMCGITWLTMADFQACVLTPGRVYARVQQFLKRAGDFTHLL